MTDVDAARAYYDGFGDRECERLEWPEGRLEFALTTRLLDPVLPTSRRVLGLGGGPGRYWRWLRDRGLTPTLADLSSRLLDVARHHLPAGTVEELVEADARDLGRWEDGRCPTSGTGWGPPHSSRR